MKFLRCGCRLWSFHHLGGGGQPVRYSRLLHPDTRLGFTERETDAANRKELFWEIWGTLVYYMKWVRTWEAASGMNVLLDFVL